MLAYREVLADPGPGKPYFDDDNMYDNAIGRDTNSVCNYVPPD